MVKRFIFLLLLICCFSCHYNKTDRTEPIKKSLSQEEIKPLIALGQLWGFLKYHHPAVAEGRYDWDRELIGLIASIRKTENEAQWKKLLDDWMASFPSVCENAGKKALPDLEIKTRPDYGELFNTEYFNPETIGRIRYILDNAIISSNHYVAVDSYNFRLNIKNEPDYKDLLYPELSFRLLALFRYWNVVNYFFPYRDLCDQKWSSVLEDMLPDFVFAANQEEYISACLRLVTKIDDSHGFFRLDDFVWGLKIGLLKVPFEAKFIEDKLVVTSYSGEEASVKDKIKIGDIITAIGGEPVGDIVKRLLPYIPASNYAVKLREISSRIFMGNSSTVSVTVQRDQGYFETEVPRYDMRRLKIPDYFVPRPQEEGYQVLDNRIGYVLPSSCKVENRDAGIKKVLDGTKGVIIDMRCYPGDYISLSFLEHLDHYAKRFSLISSANVSYPGYFFIVNGKEIPRKDYFRPGSYKNKIVVIVNEHTQSQAEDHVLGFQLCLGVTVIGSTTAGANGAIFAINLPGGVETNMTGLGVYYPDGSNLQRTGVKIDEIVRPTLAGIREGRDELLERAIAIIEESYKGN